jgi:hypothetical protein
VAQNLDDAAQGHVRDKAVRIQVRLKGVTGGERDPGKALLHGCCDMDGARQEFMYQMGAETRGAVADAVSQLDHVTMSP